MKKFVSKRKNVVSKNFQLDTPLTETGLNPRTLYAIKYLSGIGMNSLTIKDIARFSEEEIRSCRNIGEKTMLKIKALLSEVGLALEKFTIESFPINHSKAIFFILSKLHRIERQKNFDTRNLRIWLRENNLLD